MRTSDVLAANLNRLMKATPRLDTNLKIVQASDGRLSNGKLGRVRLGGKTDIETIGEIAAVFGLEPWQLLVEGLDPSALPVLNSAALLEQIKQLIATPNQRISSQIDTSTGNPSGVSATAQTKIEPRTSKKGLAGIQEFIDIKTGEKRDTRKFGGLPKPKGRKAA